MADKKPHMNLVFIGHVDHGKSTCVGRMLLDTGHIEPHIIEKNRKLAEEHGKASFEFAYVMDGLKEERERGVTIDVAHKRFDTDKTYFTIIDAPGHRDFVKNMITGTSQADAAVLIVAATEGPQAQTIEHLWLSKVLGVEKLIVAINKIDATKPAYSEDQFKKTAAVMEKKAKSVGYKDFDVIPVSGLIGDNMAKKSENMPWYTGDTLLQILDSLKHPESSSKLPFRLPVQDVYKISGVGAVPVGRIETGTLKSGDKIMFVPSLKPGGASGEVRTIEMHHETVGLAESGDNVGFNVRGIGKDDIRRGDVAGPADKPPRVAKRFKGTIMVLPQENVKKVALSVGYTPVFHCHTAQVACRFDRLIATLDPRTGSIVKQDPDFLKPGDMAIVEIVPTKPLVIEEQGDIKQMARFAIRDMGRTVAAGVCTKIMEEMKFV